MKPTNTKMEVVDFLPPPADLPNGTRYGMYSATTPQGTRFVLYQALREYAGVVETETGFTRLFVKTLPPAFCRKAQREGFIYCNPPLYVRPAALDEAVYIDLKAAFPSIYGLTGWRVEYLRGKYFIPAPPLRWPYPESWKVGRSYVVTGSRPQQNGLMVVDGKLKSFHYRPCRSNPSLVMAVYDCLSALARMAVKCLHCVYWNVDGGIIPAQSAPVFIEFARTMGLEARVKYSGGAYVYNSGLWGVGTHHTQRAQRERGPARKVYRDNIALDVHDAEFFINAWLRGLKL